HDSVARPLLELTAGRPPIEGGITPISTVGSGRPVNRGRGAEMHEPPGRHDFDFLFGRWAGGSGRLRERLADCQEWIEFEAELNVWPLLDGYANGDAFRADWGDGLVGTTLRLFDPRTGLWSIWWAGKANPVLDAPVVGRFDGDRGVF